MNFSFPRYKVIRKLNKPRKYIGPLDRSGHFFSQRSAPKTRHQIVMKRANLIKQACIEFMRSRHPHEYNQILKECAALLPEGAMPRFVEVE